MTTESVIGRRLIETFSNENNENNEKIDFNNNDFEENSDEMMVIKRKHKSRKRRSKFSPEKENVDLMEIEKDNMIQMDDIFDENFDINEIDDIEKSIIKSQSVENESKDDKMSNLNDENSDIYYEMDEEENLKLHTPIISQNFDETIIEKSVCNNDYTSDFVIDSFQSNAIKPHNMILSNNVYLVEFLNE